MSAQLEAASGVERLAAALGPLGFERTTTGPSTPALHEAGPLASGRYRLTATRGSMETRVAITLLASSRRAAEDAVTDAFAELDRVVSLLNCHDDSSSVGVLNDAGRLRGAPVELREVLLEARRLHRVTAGAFDVTVGPLVDLQEQWPTVPRQAFAEALDLVDMDSLRLSGTDVRLEREGMFLTLDGIAKGYVVDRMAATLGGSAVSGWLIDAGGDIRAAGRREDGAAWQVGIQDPSSPHGRGAYPAVFSLTDGAVATSGGYENHYDPEGHVHHIVDTRTGESPGGLESATVRAPTTMMADALATALLLMSPARALALVDALPRCACLLLDAGGRQFGSRRWKQVSHSTP